MEIPRCFNNNRAVLVCVRGDCDFPNPFMCQNCHENECKSKHLNCIMIDWNNFTNRIEKVKKDNQPKKIQLSTVIQQTIQKSIKVLQKQLQSFNKWKQTFGLPNEAVNIFQCIRLNQEWKLSGSQIAKLQNMKTQKIANKDALSKQKDQILGWIEQIQKLIREMYLIQNEPPKDKKFEQLSSQFQFDDKPQASKQPRNPKFPKQPKISIKKKNQEQAPPIKIQKPIRQLSLKLEDQSLETLQEKVKNLTEKPIHLELKFVTITKKPTYEYLNFMTNSNEWSNQLFLKQMVDKNFNLFDQFIASILKHPNLRSLKTLILYFPFRLGGDTEIIESEKKVCTYLKNLPDLQTVSIIALDFESANGWNSLGNKVSTSVDKGWRAKKNW